MTPLNITITDLTLDTVVGAGYEEAITLADMIVNQAAKELAKSADYHTIQERIRNVRAEVIRERVAAEVEAALVAEVQQTNEFGESSGPPTTLRALIAKAAKDAVTMRGRGSYGNPTPLEQTIRDEVDRALLAELAATVKAEKEKVVAAVRAKAADLIAQAVKEGVGR